MSVGTIYMIWDITVSEKSDEMIPILSYQEKVGSTISSSENTIGLYC